jgi:hypothetical protein
LLFTLKHNSLRETYRKHPSSYPITYVKEMISSPVKSSVSPAIKYKNVFNEFKINE